MVPRLLWMWSATDSIVPDKHYTTPGVAGVVVLMYQLQVLTWRDHWDGDMAEAEMLLCRLPFCFWKHLFDSLSPIIRGGGSIKCLTHQSCRYAHSDARRDAIHLS